MISQTNRHLNTIHLTKIDSGIALTAQQKMMLNQIRSESQSHHTLKAYQSDMGIISAWFSFSFNEPLPIQVTSSVIVSFVLDLFMGSNLSVLDYLFSKGYRKTKKTAAFNSITRMLASWSKHHSQNNADDPTKDNEVRALLKNLRRNKNIKTAPEKQMPIDPFVIKKMLDISLSESADIRDSALLLIAFNSGGRRVSELVEANLNDFRENTHNNELNYEWTIPRQKNDPEAKGNRVPIKGSAATALKQLIDCLKAQGIQHGALFRRLSAQGKLTTRITDDGIRKQIIKKRLMLAGFDHKKYSCHSLRSGWISTAAEEGFSDHQIMAMSCHKDQRSLAAYVRRRNHHPDGIENLIGNIA